MTAAVAILGVALAVTVAALGVMAARYRRARRSAERLLDPRGGSGRTTEGPEGSLAGLLEATEADPPGTTSTADVCAALEAVGDRLRSLERSGEVRAEWMRCLGEVVSRMTEGVVISDAEGRIVFRDDTVHPAISTRHGHALIDAALSRVLGQACEGMTVTEEVRLYGPPERILLLSASPMAEGGLALIEDVTERERVETMRRDFVSNISHELRTPIGAISLLAETLGDLLAHSARSAGEVTLGVEDRATVVGLASRMVSEADRMTRAIDDLAELSRVERDANGERSVMALQDIVSAVVERLANAAEQCGIAVGVAAPAEPVLIRADRRQIASAVHNLLDNALKYSAAGTSVNVRVRRLDEAAELSVQDMGVGIPQGDLSRIFERFYRVDRSRTSTSGGIGLGLAIVRHVAINHRGVVTVQSMEGEGSTFTMRLPLVPRDGDAGRLPPSVAESPPAEPDGAPAGHSRVGGSES
ncbi:MAG: ATP-binding protein [bacterium]|nr:ATP-binding protein [bacterium]